MESSPPTFDRERLIALLTQIQQLSAECLALASGPPDPRPGSTLAVTPTTQADLQPDFALPVRAFAKKYAGRMDGPAKFALLLAYIAKGRCDVEVSLASIVKLWNTMTGLLKTFNDAYPTRAKDQAWVDSPKRGVYVLLPGWAAIFDGHAE